MDNVKELSRNAGALKTLIRGSIEQSVIKTKDDKERLGRMHPTQKPIDICERILRLVTDEGDTILDPFAGSGSIGVASIKNNRRYIGIELDQGYYDIMRLRLDGAA